MRDDLVVAFDLLEAGFKEWDFVKYGFIFLFIGLVMQFGPKLLPKVADVVGQLFDPNFKQRTIARWLPKFFIGFSIFWILSVFGMTYTGYSKLVSAYDTGEFEVVEGFITDFRPMPKSGHPQERFSVDGVTFTYSDYNVVPGFNNTKSHGGPIDEGVYVRVSYVGNSIITLEVEPSAMVGKERNRSVSLWEMAEDNEAIDIPAPPYMAFFLYMAQPFFILSIAHSWRKSVRIAVVEAPANRATYSRITKQFFAFGFAPPVIGLLIYIVLNGPVAEGSHKLSKGIFLTLDAAALLYLNYWVYLKGGARWVAEQPGFLIRAWVIRVYATIPLLIFLGPAIDFVGNGVS